MKKGKLVMEKAPQLSPKKLLLHNWYITKLMFSAAPLGFFLYFLEQFRVNAFIFVEHTLMIRAVLECIEYGKSFREAIIPVIMVAVLLIVTSILGSIVGQWQLPKAKLKAQTKMKNMIFERAKDVDLKYFDDPEYYNDFILTVEKIGGIVDYIFDIAGVLGGALGTFVTTGVYFFTVSTPSFFLIVLSTVVHLAFIIKRSKIHYSKSVTSQKYSRRTAYIKRLFYFQDYAKELRLNSAVKERAFEDYDKAYDGLVENEKAHNRKATIISLCDLGIEMVLLDVILVLVLAYQANVLGLISYATVIVMINSTYSLRRAFTNIVYKIATSSEYCMYVEKFRSFLSKQPEIVSVKALPVSEEACTLELRNVSFRYNDSEGDVIKNVSLKLSSKEKIALVGYNGAGKTTLIKLIMRLYDPTEGVILMNGVDIKEYDVEAYRHHIGVVFQDFNLYSATVAENVVMGNVPGDSKDKIQLALKHSGFEQKLSEMPLGIYTPLTKEFEEEGINLSGGESQKIAISRAFYKNSNLIILDEPSSALDPIAEYKFNRYMADAAKDCTVIFISHRLSTTRLADRIVFLENGSVCEDGTHDELLQRCGKYAEMWHTQADKYIA